jgi:hypothetical protein
MVHGRRLNGSLDLMPKLHISNKLTAAALLLIAAAVPIGIWVVLLTVPDWDPAFVTYAFSEQNEGRWFFVLFTASAVVSLVAAVVVAFTRRRSVLASVLALSLAQAAAFIVAGGWLLGLFAGAPAYWLYRAQHEV